MNDSISVSSSSYSSSTNSNSNSLNRSLIANSNYLLMPSVSTSSSSSTSSASSTTSTTNMNSSMITTATMSANKNNHNHNIINANNNINNNNNMSSNHNQQQQQDSLLMGCTNNHLIHNNSASNTSLIDKHFLMRYNTIEDYLLNIPTPQQTMMMMMSSPIRRRRSKSQSLLYVGHLNDLNDLNGGLQYDYNKPLMDELVSLKKQLKEKDEIIDKLNDIRNKLESEMQDLSASLFEVIQTNLYYNLLSFRKNAFFSCLDPFNSASKNSSINDRSFAVFLKYLIIE